jgi:hypothetical protein
MAGQGVEQPLRSPRRTRRDQCAELGFPLSDAAALAKSAADIHEARKLVSAGCTHAIAFRIIR